MPDLCLELGPGREHQHRLARPHVVARDRGAVLPPLAGDPDPAPRPRPDRGDRRDRRRVGAAPRRHRPAGVLLDVHPGGRDPHRRRRGDRPAALASGHRGRRRRRADRDRAARPGSRHRNPGRDDRHGRGDRRTVRAARSPGPDRPARLQPVSLELADDAALRLVRPDRDDPDLPRRRESRIACSRRRCSTAAALGRVTLRARSPSRSDGRDEVVSHESWRASICCRSHDPGHRRPRRGHRRCPTERTTGRDPAPDPAAASGRLCDGVDGRLALHRHPRRQHRPGGAGDGRRSLVDPPAAPC